MIRKGHQNKRIFGYLYLIRKGIYKNCLHSRYCTIYKWMCLNHFYVKVLRKYYLTVIHFQSLDAEINTPRITFLLLKNMVKKLQHCEWSLNYYQYGFSFGNVVWYRSDLHIILCAIYYCGYILLNVDINYTQLNIFSMCRRKSVKGN